MKMRIRTIVLRLALAGAASVISVAYVTAAVSPAEMSSRVKLGGVPEETVMLRSSTAPVTPRRFGTESRATRHGGECSEIRT